MEIEMTPNELKTLAQLLMKFQDAFGSDGIDMIDVTDEDAVVKVLDAVNMVGEFVSIHDEDLEG
jgi:hypothetical protein